ncbi:hypothetical protein G9A89_016475 [Geosiphon pyriformis]|nr:hypothetical protein G9A89_016475 [Geosiphon pyriformis]
MERKTIKKISIIFLVWVLFPLVSFATVLSYIVTWCFYILYAKTDAPKGQPLVPLSPWRVFKVTLYVLAYVYENLTGPFIPSIVQYIWHKLSSERKKTTVKKNIRYGIRPRNFLDVYSPDRVSTTVLKNTKEFSQNVFHAASTNTSPISNYSQTSDSSVIILICSSWNSGNKSTCMPVAHNLQSQGYVVVVPNITLYPQGKIAEMVSDVQQTINWTHSNIRQFRGDPSQIYLMGHSAGALLSALTIIHDVCARLNVLPLNNSSVRIPHWNNAPRSLAPRVQGLILFSGTYDVTDHYAYLHHKGLEQVHALPRVMGNTPGSFVQCSPMYLLDQALNRVMDPDRLKMMLPRTVGLIHGAKDHFNPPTSAQNFFELLVKAGIPTVKVKIYADHSHISPKIDLIVPTKRICVLLLEDVKEVCKGSAGVVMMASGKLREKHEEDEHQFGSQSRRVSYDENQDEGLNMMRDRDNGKVSGGRPVLITA